MRKKNFLGGVLIERKTEGMFREKNFPRRSFSTRLKTKLSPWGVVFPKFSAPREAICNIRKGKYIKSREKKPKNWM